MPTALETRGAVEKDEPASEQTPPVPPGGLAGLYDSIQQSLTKALEPAQAKIDTAERALAESREQVVRPAVQRAQAVAQAPTPPLPTMAPEPPTPSTRGRPFLESKDSLSAVVQGLGLIGQMLGGMMTGAPAAGLAAFTGALEGWKAGDTERAEREWREYLVAVDRIDRQNRHAIQLWEIAAQTYGMNQAAAKAGLTASLALHGLDEEAITVAGGDFNRALQVFHEVGAQVHAVQNETIKLLMEQSREGFQKRRLDILERGESRKEREQSLMDLLLGLGKPGAAAPTPGSPASTFDQVIDDMALQYRGGANLSELVPRMGKFAAPMMIATMRRARAQADAAGDEPGARLIANRSLNALAAELRKVSIDEGTFLPFLKAFEKQVEYTKTLSDKVARGPLKAWNRFRLKAAADTGDVDANNLISELTILQREADRVLSRAKGPGSESTREEAKKLLDPGLSKQQFDSLIKNVLTPDAIRAVAGFRETKELLEKEMREIRTGAPKTEAPSPTPAAPKATHRYNEATGKIEPIP